MKRHTESLRRDLHHISNRSQSRSLHHISHGETSVLITVSEKLAIGVSVGAYTTSITVKRHTIIAASEKLAIGVSVGAYATSITVKRHT